MPRNLSQWRS